MIARCARARWAGAAVALLAGCAPSEQSLIDHDLWEADASADPWPEHRPQEVSCAPLAWAPEIDPLDGSISLEVEMELCNYLVVQQPSLVTARRGATVTVDLSHEELLVVDEPGQAHVAVWLGDLELLDETVPIPSLNGRYTVSRELEERVPAGTPVVLHLHNHGPNTWGLRSVTVFQ